MTDTQRRFLALHKHYFVDRWQAIFQNAMFRAFTSCGLSVTIRADEANALLESGLIEERFGTVLLTEAGKAAAA
jgi:hypothetical protein